MGIFAYIRSIFQQEHINRANPDKSYTESNTSSENHIDTSISQQDLNLDQWVLSQQQQYGSRQGLRDELNRMANTYNSELQGISGVILDDLMYRTPRMILAKYWGGDRGWRSDRRRNRWEKLLIRNDVSFSLNSSGLLIRFYIDATEWVPHPYAPPHWAMHNYEIFSQYITKLRSAYELCLKWRTENSLALQNKLSDRLSSYPVKLGSSYRCYEDTDYAEVAFLYNPKDEVFNLKTVWKNETTLAQLVREMFPDACREYAPNWLSGQRLDIYIPSLRVAIEYQGEQHYNPVNYFGGEKGYEKTIERDRRKRKLCQKAGVVVVDWRYNESISEQQLIHKLKEHGIMLPSG